MPWTALNRYVRADCGNGLTLLLLYANGFHKEPMLRYLFETVDKDKRYRIDEIWALMRCNMATLGSSTLRTSDHSSSGVTTPIIS